MLVLKLPQVTHPEVAPVSAGSRREAGDERKAAK